jgi:hypothetical protein
MIGSRIKKLAIVAGAGAVATASTLALIPFSASASATDAAATTVTVTASAHVTNGHSAKFTASLSPFKTASAPVTRASGLVTFTVTGSDSSTASCSGTNSPALRPTGVAFCKVLPGVLKASASPYTVTASYAGNVNFAPSTGTLSQSIGLAPSTVKVTVDSTPTTHKSSTFTATVSGSSGGAPTGTVAFLVTAKPHGALKCQGLKKGNVAPLVATSSTPPQMAATCNLGPSWLKLSKAAPKNNWTVVATYSGDTTYGSSGGHKSGTATQ